MAMSSSRSSGGGSGAERHSKHGGVGPAGARMPPCVASAQCPGTAGPQNLLEPVGTSVDELGILGHQLVGVPNLGEVGPVGYDDDSAEHDVIAQEAAPEDLGWPHYGDIKH